MVLLRALDEALEFFAAATAWRRATDLTATGTPRSCTCGRQHGLRYWVLLFVMLHQAYFAWWILA